jgi:hypothetical protein
MSHHFISFDCAYKTLGYVCGEIDMDSVKLSKEDLVDTSKISISLTQYGIKKLFDSNIKSINTDKRFKYLKEFLDTLTLYPDTLVYLENQWSINDKSKEVYHGIVMYMVMKNVSIARVMPSEKNSFAFKDDLYLFKFGGNVKRHTIENFKYFCKEKKYDLSLIPTKLYEHVSDAFMQMIAYNCIMHDPCIEFDKITTRMQIEFRKFISF